MKHADLVALDRLEPLLQALRALPPARPPLREKQRGVFYRGPQAFLHFHTDPAGLFADLRSAGGRGFERFPVATAAQQQALLQAATMALERPPSRPTGPPP